MGVVNLRHMKGSPIFSQPHLSQRFFTAFHQAESPARLKDRKGTKFKRELRIGESWTDTGSQGPEAEGISSEDSENYWDFGLSAWKFEVVQGQQSQLFRCILNHFALADWQLGPQYTSFMNSKSKIGSSTLCKPSDQDSKIAYHHHCGFQRCWKYTKDNIPFVSICSHWSKPPACLNPWRCKLGLHWMVHPMSLLKAGCLRVFFPIRGLKDFEARLHSVKLR